jgi:hypothetical protein
MNSYTHSHRDWSSHRSLIERDALEHLLDRHALQGRELANTLLAADAARDPRLAAERGRIAARRARLERVAGRVTLVGAMAVVLMVAMLSLALELPGVDQVARILAAGVVLVLFGLLTRPVRGLVGLLLPMHLAMSLALLGEGGWLEQQAAAQWDVALLLLGAVAAVACLLRDRQARALDLDEAQLVLDARGRGASLADLRRKAAAAI